MKRCLKVFIFPGNKNCVNSIWGNFPVVFLSLKNVDGLTFENARYQLTELVGREASRFLFLLESVQTDRNG